VKSSAGEVESFVGVVVARWVQQATCVLDRVHTPANEMGATVVTSDQPCSVECTDSRARGRTGMPWANQAVPELPPQKRRLAWHGEKF